MKATESHGRVKLQIMCVPHHNKCLISLRIHHVDIELVEASEGWLGDLPQGEHEANSGEGAFATREGPHVTHAIILPSRRLYLYMCQKKFVYYLYWVFLSIKQKKKGCACSRLQIFV